MTIDDRTTIGKAGQLTELASNGKSKFEVGASVKILGNVTTQGDVDFLRSGSRVEGSLQAGSEILRQDNVHIVGDVTEDQGSNVTQLDWDVEWPGTVQGSFRSEPGQDIGPVSPGSYGALHLKSRSSATLSSGVYFFNELALEPQSHLRLDDTNGPIYVYVLNTLMMRASLEYTREQHTPATLGYWGAHTALFEEQVEAWVLAPNGSIELRRPASGRAHLGAFFGKRVQVFSDSTVEHIPIDLAFLCGATLRSQVATHDPQAREGNLVCPELLQGGSSADSSKCFVGTSDADAFNLDLPLQSQHDILFAGAGHDVLTSYRPGAAVFGGQGDDLICGMAPNESIISGGEGNDRLIAGGGQVEVIPGPGRDNISIVSGQATLRIFDTCELSPGESYRLLGGAATLYSPISREELVGLGVEIDEGIEVIIEPGDPSVHPPASPARNALKISLQGNSNGSLRINNNGSLMIASS